jgi:membrane-bound lytic murein transglycosylase D
MLAALSAFPLALRSAGVNWPTASENKRAKTARNSESAEAICRAPGFSPAPELPMQSAPMRLLLALLIAFLGVFGAVGAHADPFPRPPAIQPMVDFWTRVYTEVPTESGLIHDSRHLDVVYERVLVPQNLSRRTRERRVGAVKKRYAAILRSLAQGRRSDLDAEERRVLALWPEGVANRTLATAARRLRFQRGQADKFRDGLIRSGRWRHHIRATFSERGLPPELSALPHVESSYNSRAYSKVGAAGLWQFTRSTGRRYLTINSAVDQRMDPFLATVAAAKLMEANLKSTGAWPLAITAYNHGAAGMRRAKRRVGTSDIDLIIEKYKSRTFGFASRNFYTEFLAAVEIDKNPERYFGPFEYAQPERLESVVLNAYYPGASIAKALGIETGLLQQLNPSLRPAVWSGQKRVPKGFSLRVPPHLAARPAQQLLADIPGGERFDRQTRDRFHRVRRGETLSIIAKRYGVSQRTLLSLNNVRNRHRIRVGQRLRLPDDPADRKLARTGHAVPVQPAWTGDEYRVRRGETLDAIARRVGSTPTALAAANGIRNANRIHVGQVLTIPGAQKPVEKAVEGVIAEEAKPIARAEEASRAEPAEPVVGSDSIATALEGDAGSNRGERAPQTEVVAAQPATAEAELPKATAEAERRESSGETVAFRPTPQTPQAPQALRALPAEGGAPAAPQLSSAGTAETLLNAIPSRWDIDGEHATVQPDETLGHYADWLEVPTQSIRSLNGMRSRSELVIGRGIRLDFSKVSSEEFRRRRITYHRALRVAYLEHHAIRGTREHVLRRGETLWEISRNRYGIPLWLLRDYNPDVDFARLQTGVRLQIPDVERRLQGSSTSSRVPDSPA